MTIRIALCLVALALVVTGLGAQTPEDRLSCQPIDHWLGIAVDSLGDKPTLFYATDVEANKQKSDADPRGVMHPITTSFHPCIRNDGFWLNAFYKNPITHSFEVSTKLGEDPNYKAAADFLESFSKFRGVIEAQDPAKEVSFISGKSTDPVKLTLHSPILTEWVLWIQSGGAACIGEGKDFFEKLDKLDESVYGPTVTSDLRGLYEQMAAADSLKKLDAELKTWKAQKTSLDRGLTELSGDLDGLAAAVLQLPWPATTAKNGKGGPEFCEPFKSYTSAKIKDFVVASKEVLAGRKKVIDDLGKLLDAFARIQAAAVGDQFRLDHVEIPRGQVRIVTVKVIQRKVEFSDTGLKITEGDPLTAEFQVLRRSAVALEFGVGAAYTNVERPKYGTAEENGQTVVASAGTESENLVAAAVLNILFRSDWGPVNPILQLGIGTGEDRPSLLAGVGLRLSGVSRMSLSVGAVFPWAKELRTLEPGSPVSGTAELEADLDTRLQDPELYVGVQYNF